MKTDELFIDCNKLPNPLSKKEIYELLDKMNHGDDSARELLVRHNIKLVLYEVIKKFSSINYDRKDLVSVGNIGLIKAINSFNTSKNVEFATYATRCIDNEILMFLRKVKKHNNVDSLCKIIKKDKTGIGLKLENVLFYDIYIEDEYIQSEIYKIIRQYVDELAASGQFKCDKGDKGDRGEKGEHLFCFAYVWADTVHHLLHRTCGR